MHNGFADVVMLARAIGRAIELVGISVIVLGAIAATVAFITQARRHFDLAYHAYRKHLGWAILLGLEFLVAGDIIGTVAVEPSYSSLGILAGIVLIRTFLSYSLELEITGRWPWQREREPNGADRET